MISLHGRQPVIHGGGGGGGGGGVGGWGVGGGCDYIIFVWKPLSKVLK